MKKNLLLFISSVMTTCAWAQTALPYNTGFDNAQGTAGWQKFRKGYASPMDWNIGGCFAAPTAPNCMGHDYPVGGAPTKVVDWYVSPPFNLSGGGMVNSVDIKVFAMTGSADANDHFGMYLLTGSADPATATVTMIVDLTSHASSTAVWKTMTNYPIAATPGTSYIAFKYTAKDNWFVPSVDELKISGTGTSVCNNPTAIQLSSITSKGAKLTWSTVSGASGYEYVVNTTQTPPTGAGTATTNLSETVNGLASGTKYYAHARAVCGSNKSSWTTSSFYSAFPTSVSGVQSNIDIKLYPNPVKDVLRITGLDAGMNICVFDITGRLLLQHASDSITEDVDLASLQPGIFLLQVSNEKFSYKTRMVKE